MKITDYIHNLEIDQPGAMARFKYFIIETRYYYLYTLGLEESYDIVCDRYKKLLGLAK